MAVVMDRPAGPDHTPPQARSTRNQVNAELVRKIAQGDQHAFRDFFGIYQARVRVYARSIVRNPGLADDVAQEVFLEIWRTAGRYDPTRGSVTAWVTQMTHARSIDRIRTAESQRRLDHHFGVHHHDPIHNDVHDALFAQVERDQVGHALAALTQVQREAIRACYFHGLTHLQVSQQLGVPLGTVKSRIRDALIQMREQLGLQTC